MAIADESYEWYLAQAIRSRWLYKIIEVALLIAASVPLSAVLALGNSVILGGLGALAVVLAGFRAVFHWKEKYLRFSAAREAVEGERRRYRTGLRPYDDPATKEQILVSAISGIKQDEMQGWIRHANQKPPASKS